MCSSYSSSLYVFLSCVFILSCVSFFLVTIRMICLCQLVGHDSYALPLSGRRSSSPRRRSPPRSMHMFTTRYGLFGLRVLQFGSRRGHCTICGRAFVCRLHSIETDFCAIFPVLLPSYCVPSFQLCTRKTICALCGLFLRACRFEVAPV